MQWEDDFLFHNLPEWSVFFFFFLSQQRCALLHPVLRNENKTLTLSCQLGTPSPIPQPSDCASDVEPLHFNQQAKHPIFLKNKSLVIFEKPRRLFKGTLQLLTTVKRYEENINIYHACMYMRTRASFTSAVGGDKVQRSAAACQQRQRRRPVACQHTCTQHKIRLWKCFLRNKVLSACLLDLSAFWRMKLKQTENVCGTRKFQRAFNTHFKTLITK